MSGYTKGPWEWGMHFCGLHDAEGRAILEFEDYEGMRFEGSESDASLIAAAPDLLEALIDVRRALELANFTGELTVVDAAIAKARGEK